MRAPASASVYAFQNPNSEFLSGPEGPLYGVIGTDRYGIATAVWPTAV
jgi:hypothetical protein